MILAADAWRWQAHPEVWFLVLAIVALGGYAVRVIGPKVVPAGREVVTRSQQRAFCAAVILLWLASDWPLHDLAEDHLYSLHMVQHLLITFVVPPLFLMATPEWLARLVLLEGGAGSKVLRLLAGPIVAGMIFNVLQALTHWAPIVNESVANGPFHYSVHLVMFAAALLMWVPVVGPLPELRLSLPGQMIYLFVVSIIPTVPAGWLTFSEGVMYDAYDHPDRLGGIDVLEDQQTAGAVMKVMGGFYLWTIIVVRFVQWARQHEAANQRRPITVRRDLTYDDVERAFRDAGPATPEPTPRPR